MVGYDHIELVMEMLEKRSLVASEVCLNSRGRRSENHNYNSFHSWLPAFAGILQSSLPCIHKHMGAGWYSIKSVSLAIIQLTQAHELLRSATEDSNVPMSLAPEEARRRMEEQFRANAERPLFTGNAVRSVPWAQIIGVGQANIWATAPAT